MNRQTAYHAPFFGQALLASRFALGYCSHQGTFPQERYGRRRDYTYPGGTSFGNTAQFCPRCLLLGAPIAELQEGWGPLYLLLAAAAPRIEIESNEVPFRHQTDTLILPRSPLPSV